MKLGVLFRSRLVTYGAINAVAALATFLTVPVLVRLLGIAHFGVWSLVEPVVFFGTALRCSGSEHGAMKQIAYDGQDPRQVIGEIATTGAGVTLIAVVIVYAVARSIVRPSPPSLSQRSRPRNACWPFS